MGARAAVRRLRLLVLALLLVLSASAGEAPAQDSLDIVAVVNDQPISKIDLIVRLQLVMHSTGLPDSPQLRARMAPEVLRSLIDERLKKAEAQRQGITATRADVERALARLAAANNMTIEQFNQAVQQDPLVMQAFTDEATAQIAWEKLVRSKLGPTINVTQQDIDDEMRRVQESLDKPQYQLAEIFIAVDQPSQDAPARQSADQLMEQLRQGAEFDRLAQQFSQASSGARGGLVGWVRPDQVDDAIATAISQMKTGDVSGPIRGTGGYYILQLRNVRQGGQSKPDPDDAVVSLKQIFMAVPSTAPKEKIDETMRQIQLVRSQVTNCADMDRVGREYTPANAIDLGRLTVGELPDELKEIGRSLPVSQISDPVQVETGIGVFMVCERQEPQGGMPTRDQVARAMVALRLDQLARGDLRDLRRAAVIDIRNAAL